MSDLGQISPTSPKNGPIFAGRDGSGEESREERSGERSGEQPPGSTSVATEVGMKEEGVAGSGGDCDPVRSWPVIFSSLTDTKAQEISGGVGAGVGIAVGRLGFLGGKEAEAKKGAYSTNEGRYYSLEGHGEGEDEEGGGGRGAALGTSTTAKPRSSALLSSAVEEFSVAVDKFSEICQAWMEEVGQRPRLFVFASRWKLCLVSQVGGASEFPYGCSIARGLYTYIRQ